MTALLYTFPSRHQERVSRVWNPNSVLRLAVQIRKYTDSSKPYVQTRSLFYNPHPYTIVPGVLQPQQQFLCGRVPFFPCTSVFFILALNALLYDRISQVTALLILQHFLSRKGRHYQVRSGLQRLQWKDAARSNTFSTSAKIFEASANRPSTVYTQWNKSPLFITQLILEIHWLFLSLVIAASSAL